MKGMARRLDHPFTSDGPPAILPTGNGRLYRAPSTAPDDRIYVIGDIHGCYDQWLDLLAKIERHSRSLPDWPRPKLVLLGDMIDRGPASAKVLRLAYEAQRQNEDLIVLLGNHEQMMLDALAGRRGAMEAWLRWGGKETLRSLGIEPGDEKRPGREYATALRAAMPGEWLDWLCELPLSMRSGDYFFCHAGIRPGIAIRRQVPRDLLWIRDEFVDDAGDHGLIVVHGHSICENVEVRYNRIGIDTGAYKTGELSALYLEGKQRALISTRFDDPMPLPQTFGHFID
jgi:serine/threonine protein phosphatase 1